MTLHRDMPDLSGRSVLIVEDAFYLAMEIQDAVSHAGGQVIGPFADARDGMAALREGAPDAAIIDINLGTGPSFDMADALRAADVPFVFLTGYDATVVPARFADVATMQKPANTAAVLRTLVAAIAGQRGATSSHR